ncbi:MAG: FAD-dependent oxidoreductase [Polyangiales bacterium]
MSRRLTHDARDLPAEAEVVVVGGGIMGLATAFHLARLGAGRVIVLEKSYLCSGASGRNGGGVRAQWSSATNIGLMKESLAICSDFATEMRINVWFRRGGYLFLARSEDRAKQLRASVELQREHGLPTRLLDAREVKTSRARARRLGPRHRQLQPGRRGGLSVALRVGLCGARPRSAASASFPSSRSTRSRRMARA